MAAYKIKVLRGLEAHRPSKIPEEGELLYTTDTKKLWVGDGTTNGGIAVSGGGDVVSDLITSSVDVTGVRTIRRVIDDLRVYGDKLTTDVKIPRKELKNIIEQLNKAVNS
jgi:hypothetical protein